MNGRLYRSVDDRMIAGVAGGMAEWLDADPGIVRLAWVVATIFTAGLAILVYIAMIIVIPEEPWVASAGSSGQVPAGTPPSQPQGTTAETTGVSESPAGPAPSAPGPPGWQPGASGWREARREEREARRAARRAARGAERGDRRPSGGAVLLGGLLIVAGIYFLAREYIPWLELNRVWPIALVGLGVLLLIRALDIGDRGSPPTSPPNP